MSRFRINLLQMNRRQTRMFITGVVVIIFMGIFPPWVHEYRNEVGGKRLLFAGYGALTTPPVTDSKYNLYGTHVDLVLLLFEWLLAAGVTFGALVYLADRNPDTSRLMRRYER